MKCVLSFLILLFMTATCSAEPEGRYLLQKPNGDFTGGAIEFDGSTVRIDGNVGLVDNLGELYTEAGVTKLKLSGQIFRIFDIGDGKLVMDPENKNRVFRAVKTAETPSWLRGTWASSDQKTAFRFDAYKAARGDGKALPIRILSLEGPVVNLAFVARRTSVTRSFLRVSHRELLAWDDKGRKTTLTRKGKSLSYSSPEAVFQVLRISIEAQDSALFLSCFHPTERDYEKTEEEIQRDGVFKEFCEGRQGQGILNSTLDKVEIDEQNATMTFTTKYGKDDKSAVFRDGRWYLVGL